MTEGRLGWQYQIYPASCNSASPTFNKWVKLTAADVHGLRQEPGFEGQNVYFHLNHPIRFVYLVGVVVAIRYIAETLVLLTLDDGSDETIEVKIERLPRVLPVGLDAKPAWAILPSKSSREDKSQGQGDEDDVESSDEEGIPDDPVWADADKHTHGRGYSWNSERAPVLALGPTPPETNVSNIRVTETCSDPYCDDRRHLVIDDLPLEIGSIIKAKGTLITFRSIFQLRLERASLIQTADEEPRIWLEYAAFVADVLGEPWTLSPGDVRALEMASDAAARAGEQARIDTSRRDGERKAKLEARRERVARHEERAERRRQAMAVELDGNPLDRPGWRPWPEVERERATVQRANEAQGVQRDSSGRERRRQRQNQGDLRVKVLRHAVRIGKG